MAGAALVAALVVGGLAARRYADAHPDLAACYPPTHTVTDAPAGTPLPPGVRGRLLVANQFSETATWIDLATRSVRHVSAGDGPHNVAISDDGRWGVVSNFGEHIPEGFSGDRLFVVDMALGRLARVIPTGAFRGLHDVSFRPGFATRVLVTAQTSRRVIEVDIATGEITGSIDTRGDRSHTLAVTADGRFAFTTNEGTATVTRLDVERRLPVAEFRAVPEVEGIAVTRDGRDLWLGMGHDSALAVVDAETGEILERYRGFRYPVRMAASADGRWIVISDLGCNTVTVADAATRRLVRIIRGPLRMAVGAVSPDGRYGFASVWPRRQVIVLDLETGVVLARFRAGRGTDGVAWGPAS